MKPVIEVKNISKRYSIGARQSYGSLREEVMDSIKSAFRRNSVENSEDTIWALKDISFTVNEGEVLGIIGRNGAGKSTLLKILSRITEPTEGNIAMRGRVASLLEVGTGFHPELTGRENIFLNGALLGMANKEIRAKFDEIVAFSEIEKFLDTPVKRYSSGMYVRLAFAVAAHLEPEILIIDEVLAVGDAAFQKKCLGKMGDVSKGGRTVLFVSHNMGAICSLCQKAILLKSGKIASYGLVSEVAENYLHEDSSTNLYSNLENIIKKLPIDPAFLLEGIRLKQNGKLVDNVFNSLPLEIEVHYHLLEKVTGFRVFFDLCDFEETVIFRSFHDENSATMPEMAPGKYISRAVIPAFLLGPVEYKLFINAGIFNVRYCLPINGVKIFFKVESTGEYNRAYLADKFRGKLRPVIPWMIEKEEN